MNSLLAILLVVNSTRGHHFMFSYPPNPQRPESYHEDIATTTIQEKKNEQQPKSMKDVEEDRLPPNASKPPRKLSDDTDSSERQDAFAGRDSIFGISVSFLADALAPRSELCDRKFQLSIDDLTFVGHPVSLTQEDSRSPTSSPSSSSDTSHNGASTTTRNEEGHHNDSKPNGATHMTLFHVVFVMSPPDLELNTRTDAIYAHVVRRYAAALQYEQLRCGYIQDEFEKILALRDDATNKGTPYDVLMQSILRDSSLARDIKQIYAAISTNNIAHIIINDFIDLSLQIPVFGDMARQSDGVALPLARTQDYYYASLMDIYGMSGYEYDNYPIICPYHTLLLLEDPEEVLKNMPLDASPTLVQLVQILTPTQSLQELHLLLDCSLAQIYRLAAHLIYWRKAKLIHTIHARNIYVVSPQAKLDDLESLNTDFKMHIAIPNLDLPRLLSELSIAKPLHMIAPKEFRNQYLEAITYLVRKDLVIQLHMFLVLILPADGMGDDEDDSFSRRSSNSNTNMPNPSPPMDTISSSPGQSSVLESRNRFKRLVHDKAPKEIAELFDRLTPFMDGKHHIEEIIYREGVTRRQLSLVLKYYRDNIVAVYHY
ncbi:nitrogen permease regulator of amino acid transport activity 3-domain-containing protein [Fennellomyces sp. T-0311]|nr:nitrogen permease regulator of amino acid transport activity 3-domain-containing protein [Fennellomyces sp. T-0311]